MAFVTKTWKDRLVEYAGRRKLKNVATGEEVLMDVSRSEGTVSQAGDAFSAANMNNLEQRIKNEFDTLNSSLTANGAQLYMDYHDGKYGVNTDPKRGADTFIPFHSGGFVFCGGSQQILRTNWTYLDYSFKFNYCKADTVSFANNIITFLQARQYKLTLNYTHNLKRIYIKAKLNNTELETRYFDTEAKRTWELELNVQKGDTLSFSVQSNADTSLGDPWCDSSMVIE